MEINHELLKSIVENPEKIEVETQMKACRTDLENSREIGDTSRVNYLEKRINDLHQDLAAHQGEALREGNIDVQELHSPRIEADLRQELKMQIDEYQEDLEKSQQRGDTSRVNYLERKINNLQRELAAHQGDALSGFDNEIHFGSLESDLKQAQKRVEHYEADVKTYKQHLKSDIAFNRDTKDTRIDLQYAQKGLDSAIKERDAILAKIK